MKTTILALMCLMTCVLVVVASAQPESRGTTAPGAGGTSEMPATASPLWLIALAGLVAVGSALALRAWYSVNENPGYRP